MGWQKALSKRWSQFFSQAYHLWGGWQVVRFVLKFCVLSSVITGIWYTIARNPAETTLSGSEQFLLVAASYSALFFLMNLGSVVFYMVLMGWLVFWMGRLGYVTLMTYGEACKLTLITGMFLLVLVLVFGHMLEISPGMVMMLVIVHAAWLMNVDLPPPLPEQSEEL